MNSDNAYLYKRELDKMKNGALGEKSVQLQTQKKSSADMLLDLGRIRHPSFFFDDETGKL